MRDVATVVFTPVLAYIVDGLSAISSMLLNLCMYTLVSINLLSSKHCRYICCCSYIYLPPKMFSLLLIVHDWELVALLLLLLLLLLIIASDVSEFGCCPSSN